MESLSEIDMMEDSNGEDELSNEGNDPGDEDEIQGPPTKKSKVNLDDDLYKPPTSDELNQLKETENLFQSSLFRLQITELLHEVQLKGKRVKQTEDYVDALRTLFMSLSAGKPFELSDEKCLQCGPVRLPITLRPAAVKGNFRFLAPKSVSVIGSFALGTAIKPDCHVDVAVEIPKDCFQQKDYLNQRYLRKRALYLTHIARQLKKKKQLYSEIKFAHHHGNVMKPVLVVKPPGDYGRSLTVSVHAFPEDGSFNMGRFHIDKNNIRSNWFTGSNDDAAPEGAANSEAPTPHYNTWVLRDLVMAANQRAASGTLALSEGVREGLVLLKVWLRQRQLDQGHGGFSSYLLTMFVLYLLSRRKLNAMMSSYQVLRNTLLHLARNTWQTEGLSLKAKGGDPKAPSLDEFHKHFDVVFVDYTGYVNLAGDLARATLLRVKHEAALSVEQLDVPGVDGFEVLLLTPIPFIRTFDHVYRIRLAESYERLEREQPSRHLDLCGDVRPLAVDTVLTLLQRALSHRVTVMAVQGRPLASWPVTEAPPTGEGDAYVTVGVLLNRDTAHSILDKGPAADSPEANEFRDFWGDKSELRRFQDGSICEAVVWPGTTLADRRNVMAHIIRHVLNRHADIQGCDVTSFGPQLDSVLHVAQPSHGDHIEYGTGEEQHANLIRSFDSLAKKLRTLSGLPLSLHNIQGISPVFRYAEVFPAVPMVELGEVKVEGSHVRPMLGQPCPPWTPTCRVVCLFEGSGKWPDDKDAVQRVKAAFLLRIGQQVQEELGLTYLASASHVDVLKDGYVFRLEIGYLKEIALQKMVTTPEGMVKMVDTEASRDLERRLVVLPKMTSSLHGLHQQNNSFSSTVRLAKRWVASQMMLGHYITEEAVELLVAHLYVTPAPYTAPSSPVVGFLRFLSLLATHDWSRLPLIVNLGQELKREDLAEIQTGFTERRDSLPLMFLATPQDRLNSPWTVQGPAAPVLRRLVLLAREARDLLQTHVEGRHAGAEVKVRYKQVFRPPLEVFDVLLHVHPTQLARPHHALDVQAQAYLPSLQNDGQTDQGHIPVLNYDPVQSYLVELRETFGDVALFFHDTYGGQLIAVLWKPDAFQSSNFKVTSMNYRRPDQEGSQSVTLIPDIDAILEDFKVIGQGLVKDIEDQTRKGKRQDKASLV